MSDWQPEPNDEDLLQDLGPDNPVGNKAPDVSSAHTSTTCGPLCATVPGKVFPGKISICMLVMVAAIVVGLYSFFTNDSALADIDARVVEEDSCKTETQNKWALVIDSLGNQIVLEEKTTAVFVLLTGENEESTIDAENRIGALTESLAGLGKNVQTVTLEIDADGYDELVSEFLVESFPAVLVTVKDCQTLLVTDDITEDTLLSTYVEASKADPACTDGAGEGSDC